MSNVQDNAAPGIYHGNLISSLQSMRDRMMAVLVPKFGEAFDGDFDAMLEAINALKRIDTSPNGGTNALSRAYGYLWHVNHPEDIPTGHPFMSADRAAIEARKELRDMLTHEQRGAGINWVRQSLIDASPKGGSEARDAARLDWLDANGFTAYRQIDQIDGLSSHCVVVHETQRPRRGNVHDTIRGAIDAAMQEQANSHGAGVSK